MNLLSFVKKRVIKTCPASLSAHEYHKLWPNVFHCDLRKTEVSVFQKSVKHVCFYTSLTCFYKTYLNILFLLLNNNKNDGESVGDMWSEIRLDMTLSNSQRSSGRKLMILQRAHIRPRHKFNFAFSLSHRIFPRPTSWTEMLLSNFVNAVWVRWGKKYPDKGDGGLFYGKEKKCRVRLESDFKLKH